MGRILTATAALAAGMLLAGCSDPPPTPAPAESSSTTVAAPRTTAPAKTTASEPAFNPSDENDAVYLAKLRELGVPVDDPDEMTLAGYGVCGILRDPSSDVHSMIDVSAWVMDVYEVPGDQAGDIAATAVDVYCPQARP